MLYSVMFAYVTFCCVHMLHFDVCFCYILLCLHMLHFTLVILSVFFLDFTAWSVWETVGFKCENYNKTRNRTCIQDSIKEVNETFCMDRLGENIGNVEYKITYTNIPCFSKYYLNILFGNNANQQGFRNRVRREDLKQ